MFKDKIVYVAGPMRGYVHFNYNEFYRVADMLYKMGAKQVINPAQMDVDAGFDARTLPVNSDWHAVPEGFNLRECVERDLKAVMDSDIVVTLEGSDKSTGATAEVAVAKWMKKIVVAAITL